jgi:microcompartment protein CcmL/EutN
VVADVMVKRAPIVLLRATPVSPGKFVVLVSGAVADVEEAFEAGTRAAEATLVDRLLLPQAHEQLSPAIAYERSAVAIEAVGVVETYSVASTVLAADAAAKAAAVVIVEMRLAVGLGGKGYFTLTGQLDQVEAALGAAIRVLDGALLVGTELIPAPHADLKARRLIF